MMSLVWADRELPACETNGVSNKLPASEVRGRHTFAYQSDGWVDASLMQLRNDEEGLLCNRLPLQPASLLLILNIPSVYGTPETWETISDLGSVSSKTPDDCGARRRRELLQCLNEPLTGAVINLVSALHLDAQATSPAGSQLHRQFRNP